MCGQREAHGRPRTPAVLLRRGADDTKGRGALQCRGWQAHEKLELFSPHVEEMACQPASKKQGRRLQIPLDRHRFHGVRGAVRARENHDGRLELPLWHEVEWKPLNREPVQEAQVRIKQWRDHRALYLPNFCPTRSPHSKDPWTIRSQARQGTGDDEAKQAFRNESGCRSPARTRRSAPSCGSTCGTRKR